MGAAALLITSSIVTDDDLESFVKSFGGSISSEKYKIFNINDGFAGLYLAVKSEESLACFCDDQTRNEYRRLLGSKERTVIEVGLNHTEKSRQLYIYIALQFCRKWNAVLDDIDDLIVPVSEIERRYRELCTDLSIDKK